MRAQDLSRQIYALVQPSLDRTVEFLGNVDREAVHELAIAASDGTACMINDSHPGGATAAQAVVEMAFGEYPPAEFWATDLGQVLFGAGGFPDRGATVTEAARVLRITHQGASHAARVGGLKRDDDDLISRESLYGKWEKRNSHAV